MQYGYKTQHSTVTALHTLNNTIENWFKQMPPPCANNHCSTQYEQSFRHNHTLIRKLLQTNIPATIIKFIANYIKGRKAYTTYRNYTSRSGDETDVPQGGVLSPTLFNIYISVNIYIHTYRKFLSGQNKLILNPDKTTCTMFMSLRYF